MTAVHDTRHLAGADNENTVAQGKKNVKILTDEDNGDTALLLIVQKIVDGVRGVDIQAAHGIRSHKNGGCCGDLASDKHLLHVTARQTAHGHVRAGGGNLQLLDDLFGKIARLFAIDEHRMSLTVATKHHIVHDIHIAEELTEDTFVRRPADKGSGSFKTWLYTMGRNRAIDYLRHSKRRQELNLDACADSTAALHTVEELYFREEKRRIVHRALKRLRPDYQQVLWLIYFEDFSCKQAAAVMKKKVHAVEMMASRARKALSEELRKEGYTRENL